MECRGYIIYEILLSCKNVYVVESRRCINVKLWENVNASPMGHLAVHVRDCDCTQTIPDTKSTYQFSYRKTRNVHEAKVIASKRQVSLSSASRPLPAEELISLIGAPESPS